MFMLHFILMMVLYFLKPARDSLFLTENGPSELPYVYILLALVSIPVTQLLTGFMRKYSIRSVLIWTLGFLAANILLIRWLFQYRMEWVFMTFYIWVGIFGILVISLFWILANNVFKPAQSKRIFPFLTLGAILGAIAGSEASSLAVSLIDISTENLLYICVVLLLCCISILFFISSSSQELEKNHPGHKKNQSGSTFKAGLKVVKSSYLLTVAIIIGLTMMATTFTDYQFKALAFDAYPEKANLTSFLGTFYAGISLASLAIQFLFSTQIIKRLGLSGAILSRPVGMMFGAILMAFEPVLASVVILNGFDGATRYSIDKTGRELLFLPVPKHTKEQTKLFIDIFVDRFSRGLAGVLLLGLVVILNWSVYLLTFIVIALLVIWVILGVRAKKGYVDKFRESVQKQLIKTDSIALNLEESTIYSIIHESLQSSNDSQVLHTLFLIEDSNLEKVAEDLGQLLKHENKEIKLKALKLLQDVDSMNYTDEIEELLNDDDPEIRLETIYYLCQHSREDPTSVIKSYLTHNDYKLKSAALGCASKHGGSATDLVEPDFFDKLLAEKAKDAVVIKAQIADALGYINDDTVARKYLAKLLDDDHPSVVRKAIASMARQKDDRFVPMLIKKFRDPNFRLEIRKALASYDSEHLILFKNHFYDDDLDIRIRKNIPRIFPHIPEQNSADQLFEMISIENPDLRYHVIKALNKLVREQPSLNMDTEKVRQVIKNEAENYYELLSIKQLQRYEGGEQLLLKVLDEKMKQTEERLFRLLGLIYDPKDMYGTYLAIQSISAEKRSAAIEFLDNILVETDHRYLFPIFDDRLESKKMEVGQNLFNIIEPSYNEGLLKLIDGQDLWLKACAIYTVPKDSPESLKSKVIEAANSSIQIIKETAELVIRRNAYNI